MTVLIGIFLTLLKQMNLREKWRGWIRLHLLCMYVYFNKQKSHTIIHYVSPFLFIVVVEVINVMMQKEMEKRLYKLVKVRDGSCYTPEAAWDNVPERG